MSARRWPAIELHHSRAAPKYGYQSVKLVVPVQDRTLTTPWDKPHESNFAAGANRRLRCSDDPVSHCRHFMQLRWSLIT